MANKRNVEKYRTPLIHLKDISEPVYHLIKDKQNEMEKDCNCKKSHTLTISQIIKEWQSLKNQQTKKP